LEPISTARSWRVHRKMDSVGVLGAYLPVPAPNRFYPAAGRTPHHNKDVFSVPSSSGRSRFIGGIRNER
jgi:hypothetical protein